MYITSGVASSWRHSAAYRLGQLRYPTTDVDLQHGVVLSNCCRRGAHNVFRRYLVKFCILYLSDDSGKLPGGMRNIVMSYEYVSVCLFLCLFVYLSSRITRKPHDILGPYLRPWLGPPLTALRYVKYFRFCG